MTEAMPFLRKLILLSYAPRPCGGGFCYIGGLCLYAAIPKGAPFTILPLP